MASGEKIGISKGHFGGRYLHRSIWLLGMEKLDRSIPSGHWSCIPTLRILVPVLMKDPRTLTITDDRPPPSPTPLYQEVRFPSSTQHRAGSPISLEHSPFLFYVKVQQVPLLHSSKRQKKWTDDAIPSLNDFITLRCLVGSLLRLCLKQKHTTPPNQEPE